jgi:mercuric ion binding protein
MRLLTGFILAALGAAAVAEDVQFTIRVDGVTCPFCVATSERALVKIPGVHSVNSDLKAGIIYVCADSSIDLSPGRLTQMFSERGFTYRSVRKSQNCDALSQRRQPGKKAAVRRPGGLAGGR